MLLEDVTYKILPIKRCYLQMLTTFFFYHKNVCNIATSVRHGQRIQTACSMTSPISKPLQNCIFLFCSYLLPGSYLPCSVNILWLCQHTRSYFWCNLLCCCPSKSFATLWAVALMFCPESCTVICSTCLPVSETAFSFCCLFILHLVSLFLQAQLASWSLLHMFFCVGFFLFCPGPLWFLHRNLLTQAFFHRMLASSSSKPKSAEREMPLAFFTRVVFWPFWNLLLFLATGVEASETVHSSAGTHKGPVIWFCKPTIAKDFGCESREAVTDCCAGTALLGLLSLFCKILCQIPIPPEGLLDEAAADELWISACEEEAAAGAEVYGTSCKCSSAPAVSHWSNRSKARALSMATFSSSLAFLIAQQ